MIRSRPLTSFFAGVFLVTWSIAAVAILAPRWFASHFGTLDPSSPAFFVAVYAPTIVSITLTALFEGRTGLAALARRLDPRRCHPVWYLVVIGGFLALDLVSGWAGGLLGQPRQEAHWGTAGTILLGGLVFDPGPLGEELGWRGFALPRMLDRWNPLVASLGLGGIWAVWHLPAFLVSSTPQSQLSLPLFLLGAMSLSVVMGWLFVRSNGSVLIAILTHAMANHALDIAGASFNQQSVGLAAAAVLLVATGQLRTGSKAAGHRGSE